MYHCYVLRSLSKGRYYIGSCEDIDIRLRRHNNGSVKSTKAFAPWELMASESFSRSEATTRERQLKSWKSRCKVEEYIAKRNRESSVDCGGPLAQLVRAPHLQCGGHRFESGRVHHNPSGQCHRRSPVRIRHGPQYKTKHFGELPIFWEIMIDMDGHAVFRPMTANRDEWN